MLTCVQYCGLLVQAHLRPDSPHPPLCVRNLRRLPRSGRGVEFPLSPTIQLSKFTTPKMLQFCTILVHSKSFRMNTSKSVSKQTTLTPFRMNTYEKQGEGSRRDNPNNSEPPLGVARAEA